MKKLIVNSAAAITLTIAQSANALTLCDRSFSAAYQMNLTLTGDAQQGTLEGRYNTSDISLLCGGNIYVRGMYAQVSPTSWHFFFTAAEGESGSGSGTCPPVLYDGIWEGSSASSGTVYTANGNTTTPMELSAGSCNPIVIIPPLPITPPPPVVLP